jgi:hypothetical protein
LSNLTKDKQIFDQSKFDLEGAILTSTSADFYNEISLKNCNSSGYCSRVTGFSVDLVDELAKLYNFTWWITKFKDGDWGSNPIGGNWSAINLTFGGIYGRIFYIIFDCCKQSLNRRLLPSTHPSTHPPIHPSTHPGT